MNYDTKPCPSCDCSGNGSPGTPPPSEFEYFKNLLQLPIIFLLNTKYMSNRCQLKKKTEFYDKIAPSDLLCGAFSPILKLSITPNDNTLAGNSLFYEINLSKHCH